VKPVHTLAIILGLMFAALPCSAKAAPPPRHVLSPKDRATTTVRARIAFVDIGKVFFPHLSRDGLILYYFGDHGTRVKRFHVKTKKTDSVYPNEIYDAGSVAWSPDGTKAIIFPIVYKSDKPARLLDLRRKTLTLMSPALSRSLQLGVLWSPSGDKICFHHLDTERGNKGYLAVANPNGSGERKLIDVRYPEYGLVWLNNARLLGYWSEPGELGGTVLNAIDPKSRLATTIFGDYRLAGAIASPDGRFIAYERFYKDWNDIRVSIAAWDGSNNRDYGFHCWTGKMAWSPDSRFLFLAERRGQGNDAFYRIAVPSGAVTKVEYTCTYYLTPYSVSDALTLMPSPDGRSLHFTSHDFLYQLTLDAK
jgi:hypothetical protein